jgi:putative ABC transport system ATP-binding protein
MALFQELNDNGKTIILITHEHDIAQHAKRIVHVKDGRILSDEQHAQVRVRPAGVLP